VCVRLAAFLDLTLDPEPVEVVVHTQRLKELLVRCKDLIEEPLLDC
jgi:hypothetical protein